MNKIKIGFIITIIILLLIILIFLNIEKNPEKNHLKNDTNKDYICLEAIKDYNNLYENRINIVFAGYNYNDFEEYKFIVETAIDVDSNNYGILSVEPFKSHKNKFNFWYVDNIQKMEPLNRALIGKQLTELKCDFSITHPIGLLNAPASDSRISSGSYAKYTTIGIREIENIDYEKIDCSKYDLNKDNCVDIKDAQLRKEINKNEDIDFTLCFNTAWGCEFKTVPNEGVLPYMIDMKLLLHEFGHGFALLGDEYVTKTAVPEYPVNEKYFADNCYPAKSEKECLTNAPWKDFVGDDCNNDGKVECEKNGVEIGCYEGCANFIKGIYRPTKTSIMNIPGKPFTYGIFNENLICKRMNEILGENVC